MKFSANLRFTALAAVLLASSLAAQAQQAPAASTPAAPNARATASRAPQAYHAAPAAQRADKMSQEIGKQLGLDAATTDKVRAAALTRCQKIDDIQNGAANNKDKSKALQANAQDFKTALQGILTPAQYTQYTSHGGKKSQPKGQPID